jgi:hypothetical protein
MFEYQYSVSQNGRFVFRTAWIDSEAESIRVATVMLSTFTEHDGYRVDRIKRSLVMESDQIFPCGTCGDIATDTAYSQCDRCIREYYPNA